MDALSAIFAQKTKIFDKQTRLFLSLAMYAVSWSFEVESNNFTPISVGCHKFTCAVCVGPTRKMGGMYIYPVEAWNVVLSRRITHFSLIWHVPCIFTNIAAFLSKQMFRFASVKDKHLSSSLLAAFGSQIWHRRRSVQPWGSKTTVGAVQSNLSLITILASVVLRREGFLFVSLIKWEKIREFDKTPGQMILSSDSERSLDPPAAEKRWLWSGVR